METYLEKATFICGHRKAGTTLLLCLLDNHPELLVYPPDSAFFYLYYPTYDSPVYTDEQKVERIECMVDQLEYEINGLSESDRKDLNFPIDTLRKDVIQLLGLHPERGVSRLALLGEEELVRGFRGSLKRWRAPRGSLGQRHRCLRNGVCQRDDRFGRNPKVERRRRTVV